MSRVVLEQVSNFDRYPDGRIRLGPFGLKTTEITQVLTMHKLFLSREDDRGMCSKNSQGIMVSCSGMGVYGYLLDEDGLEATSSDVDMFLEQVLQGGTIFSIEGHYCPEPDIMVHSRFSAWMSSGMLQVSSSRILHRKGEAQRIIHARVPNTPIEQENCRLSLAG